MAYLKMTIIRRIMYRFLIFFSSSTYNNNGPNGVKILMLVFVSFYGYVNNNNMSGSSRPALELQPKPRKGIRYEIVDTGRRWADEIYVQCDATCMR